MDLEITMLSEESLKEKDDITASYVAFTGAAGVSTLLSSLGYDEKSWFPLGPFWQPAQWEGWQATRCHWCGL